MGRSRRDLSLRNEFLIGLMTGLLARLIGHLDLDNRIGIDHEHSREFLRIENNLDGDGDGDGFDFLGSIRIS